MELHGRGSGGIPLEPEMTHAGGFRREQIGQDGNDPLATQGENGQGLVVVAGIEIQLSRRQGGGGGDLGNIGAGFLDGGDVLMLRQAQIGLRLDIYPRPAGYVVEDQRLCHRVGDHVIHFDEAVLRGLDIVGSHHQQPVGSHLAGILAHADGNAGLVGAGAGDHGYPARDALGAVPQNLLVLGDA